jgi:hypothetical protein
MVSTLAISGDVATGATSNIWGCRIKCRSDQEAQVTELRPVQDLDGTGSPFKRLADLLAAKQFSAAAIDAPFSLPSRYVPVDGWLELLKLVDALPLVRSARRALNLINFGSWRKKVPTHGCGYTSFAAIAAYRDNPIRPDADDATVLREGWIAIHA